jgi:hypothetical protein
MRSPSLAAQTRVHPSLRGSGNDGCESMFWLYGLLHRGGRGGGGLDAAASAEGVVTGGFAGLHLVNSVTRVSAPASTVNEPGQMTSSIAYGGSIWVTPRTANCMMETWGWTPSAQA